MTICKRLCLLLAISIVSQIAVAQWKYTSTVTKSGNCNGNIDALGAQIWGAIGKSMAEQTSFPTREQCEAARASNSGTWTEGGCTTRVVTTPCTGPASSTNAIGSANILGPSQGNSFYSTNGANDIRDWANDNMERMLALDKKNQPYEPSRVTTGDIDYDKARNGIDPNMTFVPINMREGGSSYVQSGDIYFGEVLGPYDERWKYFLEKDFTDNLHSEYFKEKNINIEDILLKANRTQFEQDLIKDYEKWKERKLAETVNLKDMAICAAAAYAEVDTKLLANDVTKYKIIDNAPDEAMNRLLKLVDMCNNEPMNQGFHAEVLYNDETKEYVVSFRGTEAPSVLDLMKEFPSTITSLLNPAPGSTIASATKELTTLINNLAEGNTSQLPPELHDISTDASQAIGHVLTQYKMAIEVGDVIKQISETNPNININITGHSMGGGEAIVAGAISGQPTYAFNPAGVHEETFTYAGIDERKIQNRQNIHKITTDDDPLTNAQESIGSLGQKLNKVAKGLAYAKGANTATSVPKAVGRPYVLHTGKGHSIEPIAHLLIKKKQHIEQLISQGESMQSVNIIIE